MSNSDEVRNENGATDPIVPIDFTPHSEEKKAFSYKFKWLHVFVASFLLVSLTAAWFVLTARSVFVEVDPITAEISIDTGTSFKLGSVISYAPDPTRLPCAIPGITIPLAAC